ncbi:protein RISC-INTERACTING CLEARING 3'-5' EXORIBONUCLEASE 2-like [Cornus florida]|uniref:protein RISC-INTERACTING CLEARING 3'-5' EXORIBONUCLEASE 2-like n=1 Tax=Cornus florida TaxID=4283 RepID=UPI00289AD3C9|nr:protein RISC-INTERACTING CLEARING 3'-5' EXORIBONUCLEASE 2-like [Cornus florida]
MDQLRSVIILPQIGNRNCPKFEMDDGEMVLELVSDEDKLESCLNELWAQRNKKIIVFDLLWKPGGISCKGRGFIPEIVQLVLGTEYNFFFVESKFLSYAILKNFLALKDATFVGIHIAKDLAKLENDYGIVFRNAVDISEHAAYVLRRPSLRVCGVSELASEVGNLELKEKPAICSK